MSPANLIKILLAIIGNIILAQYLIKNSDFILIILIQITILLAFTLAKILMLPEERQMEKGEFKSRKKASIFEAILPIFEFYNKRYQNSAKSNIFTLCLFPFILGVLFASLTGIVLIFIMIYSILTGVPQEAPSMTWVLPTTIYFIYEMAFLALFAINYNQENARNIINRQKNATIPIAIALTILLVIYEFLHQIPGFISPFEVVILIIALRIIFEIYTIIKEGK